MTAGLPLWFWYGAGATLGAIIGSFLATLCLRWPEGKSVIAGRSHCDGCGYPLTATDLIPLLSAAISRGRCRICSVRIDPFHWQVELAALAIGLAAQIMAPGLAGLGWAIFGWLLLPLAILDARYLWLPNPLVALLAVSGLLVGPWTNAIAMPDRLIGAATGFGSLWIIARTYAIIRKREGMGAGDPKMLGAIGCWIGWQALPVLVIFAGLCGIIWAICLNLRPPKSVETVLPMGTLMALAVFPAATWHTWHLF